jgi:hypothetical protein
VRVNITFDGLEETITALQATPRQIATASRRAVSTVTRQTNRAILQEMAAGAGVTQRLLRTRRRVIQRLPKASQGDRPSGSVWVGTLPLPAGYLATNAQRARVLMGVRGPGGVTVGGRLRRYTFEGAFWAEVGAGHAGIFKRKGRARLPLVEQTIPLNLPEAARARIEGEVPLRLAKALGREIRFEVLVKGRR